MHEIIENDIRIEQISMQVNGFGIYHNELSIFAVINRIDNFGIYLDQ